MIRHVVMWKLPEDEDKQANAQKIKEQLEELTDTIGEIKHLEVGINIKESDAAYDVVLISDFDNENDLQIYAGHPKHQEVADFIGSVVSERVVVDYQK